MKLGNFKIFFSIFALFILHPLPVFSDDKIDSVPLINLEELSILLLLWDIQEIWDKRIMLLQKQE